MASKLIFDPQTLIDEEKENEQKKVKEVISAQEAYDQLLEEENAKVENKVVLKNLLLKLIKLLEKLSLQKNMV